MGFGRNFLWSTWYSTAVWRARQASPSEACTQTRKLSKCKFQLSHRSLHQKEDDDDLLLDSARESGQQIMKCLAACSGSWKMHSDKFLACTSLKANEVPERMYSGTDGPSSSRSSAGLMFSGETNSVRLYSLLAQPFPYLMMWSTLSFSTQVAQWSKLAYDGVNSCLVLHNTVTCLCWTSISLQVILRCFCHFPLPSPPPCLPVVGFMAEQSLHTET